MSVIYLDDNHERLKGYSAAVNGGKSIVTIRIECTEPVSLGYLLECLGKVTNEQTARDKAAKEAARPSKKKSPLTLPPPPLQLPYFGEAGDV